MKKLSFALLPVLCLSILCSCSGGGEADGSGVTSVSSVTSEPAAVEYSETAANPRASSADLFADFGAGASDKFERANGWCNGSMFNVTWRKDNCVFEDGVMKMSIDIDTGAGKTVPYSGAEYRTKDFYGYGLYEVSMKPIKKDGTVSSFFTYTGPSDSNPWDEIDIEFLGKDTTIVQFNYFTDGKGNHEKIYELGFDASEEFHTYGFEWSEDRIAWFVDGKEVHSAEADIPVTESKIMMNTWCGTGVDGWLKPFDESGLPVTAEYAWVAFTAAEK